MQRSVTLTVVFCLSVWFLGTGAGSAGIATNWVDPIGQIQAQDEAVYAASTFTMVEQGDWLTPHFMNRLALHKPPLLYWLSGGSVRILGKSPSALRWPSVLAGAGTITLVLAWVWRAAPLSAALTAALLLASSHLFFVLSRVAMTDGLLVFEIVAALFAVHRDPAFTRRSTPWLVGVACGAAILTKAIAGTLPLAICGLSYIFSLERPGIRRVLQTGLVLAAVALPWHLYQIWVHPRWFWTEYVLRELFAKGMGSPAQTSGESQVWFYATRLVELDPVLLGLAGAAAFRVRPGLIASWIVVTLATALSFHYRNVSYILPVFPALAILVGLAIPEKLSRAALVVAMLIVGIKAGASGRPWGLPFAPEFVNPSHAALDEYAALHRGRELIIVEPDDQFYAALIHLPRVRYLFLGDPGPMGADPLDFWYLGVTVDADDFDRMGELLPVFEKRLREFGLPSTKAAGTVIWARDKGRLDKFIVAHPRTDFYVPQAGGRVFLLGQ